MKLRKRYIIGALTILLAVRSYKFIDSTNVQSRSNNNQNNYATDYKIDITNPKEDSERGYFLTNEDGQTYGTYIDKNNCKSLEPDLMLVEGINGKETITGYVKKVDLYDEENQPNNPEEAVKYMKKLKELKKDPLYKHTIPVYTHDGKTIIGEFEIQI